MLAHRQLLEETGLLRRDAHHALGALRFTDGIHIEVHSCPEKALSDGPQALLPKQYADLMITVRKLAQLMGKTY